MEENEFSEPSFGELIDLVRLYENAEKNHEPLFLDEDNYERIVRFYEENREYNKAQRVLDRALEQHRYSAFLHTLKAEILVKQNRLHEALYFIDEAEKLDPMDVNTQIMRADMLLWDGQPHEALQVLQHALQICEDDLQKSDVYLEIADVYDNMEKYDEVIEALKTSLRYDAYNEEALNRLMLNYMLSERHWESVKFHEALLDEHPYNHVAWYNLANAYMSLKNYEKAHEALGYAIAIAEDYAPAHGLCGDLKFLMSEYATALEHYLDAAKYDKPYCELYYKIAECYTRLNALGKARAYLRKAIGLDAHYHEAYYRLGELYAVEDNWTKAISAFERALKICPESADYNSAIGIAYLRVGENEKAIHALETAYQLDAEDISNWINLALAYMHVNNPRKALQVMTEAEEEFPGYSEVFYLKAVFYRDIGKRREALVNLQKGLMLNFEMHTILYDFDEEIINDVEFTEVIQQYRIP
ncbi:MAG: tetratricopeptide repeat protein [Chitinophagales bacterium]|nr:tetratricopeptide repeat protein [Chitinophagales bacterium]MDW8419022.1 tetratricopeptide repeat protein [Chitinophagales bacterium]